MALHRKQFPKKKNNNKKAVASQSTQRMVKPLSATGKWFDLPQTQTPAASTETAAQAVGGEAVERARAEASQLLQAEAAAAKGADAEWLRAVASGGSRADRPAALALRIRRSPPHCLADLDALLVDAGRARRPAAPAHEALKELFINSLLPPERKLRPLAARPLGTLDTLPMDQRRRRLVMWYFEDELKTRYENFVRILEKLCHDTVVATRLWALTTLAELLSTRPEQEQLLLTSVVNKFGDGTAKVASRVGVLLAKVVATHPNMRLVIVREVERLVYRPNVSQRAQFYAVCFLSQTVLAGGERELAVKLLDIYFGLFRVLVGRGEIDNRMLMVLLTGTNRAFPYAKDGARKLLNDIDSLYKVVAKAQFGTALQTLMLLFQVLEHSSEGVSDRYYSALYRKLGDAGVHGSARLPLLLHLLLKTMRADAVDRRVVAFVKRLLQLALGESAAFACAALVLCSNLVDGRPGLLRIEHACPPAAALPADGEVSEAEGSGDEHLDDAHGDDSDTEVPRPPPKRPGAAAAGWLHRSLTASRGGRRYEPAHRNPLFAGADATLCYELGLLARHYHPSVALFAQRLMAGERIDYDGDPLDDFTLTRFLERFVYRNPKKADGEARRSTMARRKLSVGGAQRLSVTSAEYLRKRTGDVPADERFLHRYLTTVGRPNAQANESDIDSVDSDEFDRVLEKFEPGAKNDAFDVDFSREFSQGKKKKRRRRGSSDEDVDDEEDEAGFEADAAHSAERIAEWMESTGDDDDRDGSRRPPKKRGKFAKKSNGQRKSAGRAR